MLYLIAFVITIAVNVPLNDAIKAAGSPDHTHNLAGLRERFHEARWAAWNLVRVATAAALVGFSPRKANLVLYLVGGVTDRYPNLLERLGPHKAGKGCLYLKRLDDVDREVLQELVERTLRVHRGADRTPGS